MIQIIPISALTDNYIWLFKSENTTACHIVDPGDASVVLEFLSNQKLSLESILITHHHGDHTGGVRQLCERYKGIRVYGPNGACEQVTHVVNANETISCGHLNFRVIKTPGHTLDHIAYFADINADKGTLSYPILFCGDTLFAGGCGRLFEGTAAQMHQSLRKISSLPATTKIYCAHEYTCANLKFALAVEPNNKSTKNRLQASITKRNNHKPTIPSLLSEELDTNPFLRVSKPSVIHAANKKLPSTCTTETDEQVFSIIRQWKDHFTNV
ncbi:Hydroxyacylglutathione hydrolase GloB [invertebrate metagenome]|uniref:hydroxyacylglutathione hydrolase n=1 Tax=invertebrate metagenome TaxID=1711999 RepID=A0A2H9T742_9ZZZZ